MLVSRIGKVMVIAKLEVHCAAPATARPEPRIWLGNISPNITHITGPHDMLKNTTYTLAATKARTPIESESASLPAASRPAVANAYVTSASDTAMPAEPTHSSGLRPILSISTTVTRQAPMLSAPDSTLISSASL